MNAPKQQKSETITPFLVKLRELKELYRKKNYELADELGIQKRQLINLFNGKKPSPSVERLLNFVYERKKFGSDDLPEESKVILTRLSSVTGLHEVQLLHLSVKHFMDSLQKEVGAKPVEVNSSSPVEELSKSTLEDLKLAIAVMRLKAK